MGNKFKFEVGDRVEDKLTGKGAIIEGATKDYYRMDWEDSPMFSHEMHKDNIFWKNIKKIGAKMSNYIYLDGKKIELSNETVKNFREQLNKEILVPEIIKITIGTGSMSKGIAFNDGRQELCYNHKDSIYIVACSAPHISCKLTPCKREELVPGDLAFWSDYKETNFKHPQGYCIILPNEYYVHVEGKGIMQDCIRWDYWWKVEEVE